MTTALRRNRANIYVATMIVCGAALLVALAADPSGYITGRAPLAILALAIAVVIGEIVPVKMGPDQGEVAPSTTFAFALLMTAGVAVAVLAQAIASICADLRDGKPPVRIAFNAAQYTIALFLSWLVLDALSSLSIPAHFSAVDIVAFGLAGATFFLVNAACVATAVAFHTETPIRRVFASDLTFHAGTEVMLLGLAPLAVLAVDYSPLLLPTLVLPLIAINRAGRHAVLNERLALHDTLTNLPNRVLFQDRANLALAADRRDDTGVSLMLIDLDRFKEINDTLGHHVGDEVLCRVADRLRATLREGDTVARLGGDEFAIILGGPIDGAEAVATKLRAAVAEPIDVRGIPLVVGASVGIASFPRDGENVETLMQKADVAMYHAKTADGGVKHYESDRDDNSVARLTQAAALRRAIDDGAIEVHFQPQFDGRSGILVGVEALARWEHDGEWVSPDGFIPVAERTGLIVPLTLQVMDVATRELAGWRAAGIDITVSVNLSARALTHGSLPDHVATICTRWDVPATALVMEITETMVATDPQTTLPIIERLAAMGATISIDDFGTGFSSLEYLKLLRAGELKIDRSFVGGMLGDPRDQAIVGCAIELGHRLGLRVVAEGVDTSAVRAQLALMECDILQGFLLGSAVPAAEVTRLHARTKLAAQTASQQRSA